MVVGRLRRLPLVVHFQGPWAEESRVAGRPGGRIAAKRWVESSVYRRASRICAVGRLQAVLVERYGIAPWRIEVIPPGIDLALFMPGSREEARAALGLYPADRSSSPCAGWCPAWAWTC